MLNRVVRKLRAFILNARYHWYRIRGVSIDRPPVFIVGCGHSGTWLLLSILAAHSRIFAIPYESRIATKNNKDLFQKTITHFDRMAVAAGKNRWVEKTPMHIEYIGQILDWCPAAKILLIIRDGRDVAYSHKERYGNAEKGIQRWVEANRAGEHYWSHPSVHVLRYEELVTHFEDTVRSTLHFLGEEYEESLKEFHKHVAKWFPFENKVQPPDASAKDNRDYRKWQISQPLFDGRGRWKQMTQEELAIINKISGEMLMRYGYTNESKL